MAMTSQSINRTGISSSIPHLANSRLQHVLPGLRWMNKLLTVDIEFGRVVLIIPNDNGGLAIHNLIVDTLAQSFDIVLDPTRDVGFCGIAKQGDSCVVTISRPTKTVYLTIQVLLVV